MKTKWTIGKKLTLAFSGIALITLIVGIMGYYGVTRLGGDLIYLGNDRIPALQAFSDLNMLRMVIRAQTNEAWIYVNSSDARDQFKDLLSRREKRWKEIDKTWEEILKVKFRTEEGKKLHATFQEQFKNWRNTYSELDNLVGQMAKTTDPKVKEQLFRLYRDAIHRMTPVSDAMGNTADLLTKNNIEVTQKLIEADDQLSRTLETTSLISVILGVILALTLGLIISRRISLPVRKTTDILEPLSQGDLTVELQVTTTDEVGVMAFRFNEFIHKLSETLHAIVENTNQVLSATGEVSQGNQDLSQRVNSQSAALEETASSIEEMTANIKSMAENANIASKLNAETESSARKGEEEVRRAVEAIQNITEKTEKIQDIIKIIDGIAFQTNILALNAAVEAARAKEHGKGFAVVANEVRNLAQKSAENAKQIAGMIEEIVKGIQTGNQLVEGSQERFMEIKSKIEKTTGVINEVAAAAAEQTEGVDQINQAVSHLDEITQANASLVEEVAASSEELEGQSREIIELMKFFKLKQQSSLESVKKAPAVKHTTLHRDPPKPSKKEPVQKKEEVKNSGSNSSKSPDKKETSHPLSRDGFMEF